MNPINYDLIISLICAGFGLYMLIFKLHVCERKVYTPVLGTVIVFLGLLSWCTIALISYSAISFEPNWAYSEGWRGSWAYTTARVFFAVMWFSMLYHITKYSPKSKKESKLEI